MADPAGPFTRGGETFFTLPSTGAVGAPTTGTWKVRQPAVDTTGALWLCTAAGSPGTWVAAGGGASGPPFIGSGTPVAATGMFRAANGSANGIYWRNFSDTNDIGWSVGAFDNISMVGSATALYLAAGGVKGTVEKLRVGNTATTADNAANSLFVASATGSKPIVSQGLAGQTGNLFEAQTSSGAAGIVASISAAGAIFGASYSGVGSVASTGVLRQANGGGSGVFWRNNAGTGDIGWNVGAFDNIATQGTTAVYVTAGGARGTVEVLRVGNTAPTGDNAANALFLPSGTGTKPVVVQLLAGQTANAVEVQGSTGSGAILASISAAGAIVSAGLDAGSSTIVTTGAINGATITASTALRSGAAPSATGALRMSALGQINWRNGAGTADVGGFSTNASDQLQAASDLMPSSDSSKNFGSAALRWASIFGVSATLGGANASGTGLLRTPNNSSIITARNAANSADVVALAVDSSNAVLVGGANQGGLNLGTPGGGTGFTSMTGASGVNINAGAAATKFNSTSIVTNDANADAMMTGKATTKKPLVVQGQASQTAVLQEWQSSAGTALASVAANGTFTAQAVNSVGLVYFAGNINKSINLDTGVISSFVNVAIRQWNGSAYATWMTWGGTGSSNKTITFADAGGTDFVLGTTTGTKWGTATGQKQAWWGATPVVQQVLPTGAGKTVDDVITFLQLIGLCKQS